ncbi:MAG: CoA pyrophosphatase [Aeromonas sp.]
MTSFAPPAAWLTRYLLTHLVPARGGLSAHHALATQAKPAAVLLLLQPQARRGEYALLFTRRSPHLRHHPGQIAFPGGRYDAADGHLNATAVRETVEEMGVQPADIQLQGQLTPLLTGTGFWVQPVVGLLAAQASFRPALQEVAAYFFVPLSALLDLSLYHTLTLPRTSARPAPHTLYAFCWQQQLIWGATAQMTYQLAVQLQPLAKM